VPSTWSPVVCGKLECLFLSFFYRASSLQEASETAKKKIIFLHDVTKKVTILWSILPFIYCNQTLKLSTFCGVISHVGRLVLTG